MNAIPSAMVLADPCDIHKPGRIKRDPRDPNIQYATCSICRCALRRTRASRKWYASCFLG